MKMENMQVTLQPRQLRYCGKQPINIRLVYKRVLITTDHVVEKYQSGNFFQLKNSIAKLIDPITFHLSKQFQLKNTKICIIIIGVKGGSASSSPTCLGEVLLDLTRIYQQKLSNQQLYLKLNMSKDQNAQISLTVKFSQKPLELSSSNKKKKQYIPQLQTLKTEAFYKEQLYIARRQKKDYPTAYQISHKNFKQTQILRKDSKSNSKQRSVNSKNKNYYTERSIQSNNGSNVINGNNGNGYNNNSMHSSSQHNNYNNYNPINKSVKVSDSNRNYGYTSVTSNAHNDPLAQTVNHPNQGSYKKRFEYETMRQQERSRKKSFSKDQNIGSNYMKVYKQKSPSPRTKTPQQIYPQKKSTVNINNSRQQPQQQQKPKPLYKIQKPDIKITQSHYQNQNQNNSYSNNHRKVNNQYSQNNRKNPQYQNQHQNQNNQQHDYMKINEVQPDTFRPNNNMKNPAKKGYSDVQYEYERQLFDHSADISNISTIKDESINNINDQQSHNKSLQEQQIKYQSNRTYPQNSKNQKPDNDYTSLNQKFQIIQNHIRNKPNTSKSSNNNQSSSNNRSQVSPLPFYEDKTVGLQQQSQIQDERDDLQDSRQGQKQPELHNKPIDSYEFKGQHFRQQERPPSNRQNLQKLISFSQNTQKQTPKYHKNNNNQNIDSTIPKAQVNAPSPIIQKTPQLNKNQEKDQVQSVKMSQFTINSKQNKGLQTPHSNTNDFTNLEQINSKNLRKEESNYQTKRINNSKQKPKQGQNLNSSGSLSVASLQNKVKMLELQLQQSRIKFQKQNKNFILCQADFQNLKLQKQTLTNKLSQKQTQLGIQSFELKQLKQLRQLKLKYLIQQQAAKNIKTTPIIQQSSKKQQLQSSFTPTPPPSHQAIKQQYEQKIQRIVKQNKKREDSLSNLTKSQSKKQTQFLQELKRKQILIQKLAKVNQENVEKLFNLQKINQNSQNKYNELDEQVEDLLTKNEELQGLLKETQQELELFKFEQQKEEAQRKKEKINQSQKLASSQTINTPLFQSFSSQSPQGMLATQKDFKQEFMNQKKKTVNLQAQLRYKQNQIKHLNIRIDNLKLQKNDLESQIDMIAFNDQKQLSKKGSLHKVAIQSKAVTDSVKLQNKVLKEQIRLLHGQIKQLTFLIEGTIQKAQTKSQISMAKSTISQNQLTSQKQIFAQKYIAMQKRLQAYQSQLRLKKNKMAELINAVWKDGNATLIDQIDKIMGMQQ